MHPAAADRLTATEAAPARRRFERGRARVLAVADVGALALAYATSYAPNATSEMWHQKSMNVPPE